MSQIQTTITPVDGSVYAERELATATQIEAVLQRATEAQRGWRETSIAERAALVSGMVDWLVARKDELGSELS